MLHLDIWGLLICSLISSIKQMKYISQRGKLWAKIVFGVVLWQCLYNQHRRLIQWEWGCKPGTETSAHLCGQGERNHPHGWFVYVAEGKKIQYSYRTFWKCECGAHTIYFGHILRSHNDSFQDHEAAFCLCLDTTGSNTAILNSSHLLQILLLPEQKSSEYLS